MDTERLARKAGTDEEEVIQTKKNYEYHSLDRGISGIPEACAKHWFLPEEEAEDIVTEWAKKMKGVVKRDHGEAPSRVRLRCRACGDHERVTNFGSLDPFCPECGYLLYISATDDFGGNTRSALEGW